MTQPAIEGVQHLQGDIEPFRTDRQGIRMMNGVPDQHGAMQEYGRGLRNDDQGRAAEGVARKMRGSSRWNVHEHFQEGLGARDRRVAVVGRKPGRRVHSHEGEIPRPSAGSSPTVQVRAANTAATGPAG